MHKIKLNKNKYYRLFTLKNKKLLWELDCVLNFINGKIHFIVYNNIINNNKVRMKGNNNEKKYDINK